MERIAVNLLVTLEYDGAEFHGWQRQINATSVQQELERALNVYAQSLAKRSQHSWSGTITVQGSGRTDAGVHALAQAANFFWPNELPLDFSELYSSINGISSSGLNLRSIQKVPDSFNARKATHTKRYRYQLLERRGSDSALERKRCWVLHSQLDVKEMILAAAAFVGTHDFSSFRAADCGAESSVRTILLSEFSRRPDGVLVYSIEGKGFLKQMVRTIVGTLVDVGRGQRSASEIATIIEQKDRNAAGDTAPAHGLFLENVRYPDSVLSTAEGPKS